MTPTTTAPMATPIPAIAGAASLLWEEGAGSPRSEEGDAVGVGVIEGVVFEVVVEILVVILK